MSDTTTVPAPELPDVDTDQLVRLLRALLDGYVPKEHSHEAEALASAIEVHVRQMGQRLIGESFGIGAATAVAVLKEEQLRTRIAIPSGLLVDLLTAKPTQTH